MNSDDLSYPYYLFVHDHSTNRDSCPPLTEEDGFVEDYDAMCNKRVEYVDQKNTNDVRSWVCTRIGAHVVHVAGDFSQRVVVARWIDEPYVISEEVDLDQLL
jgi:hypothetical protein